LADILSNKPLQQLNTFNVKAAAANFLQIDSIEQLMRDANLIVNYSDRLVLGGGSNLLFIADYKGLVIYPQLFGIEVLEESDTEVRLKVAASENWHQFVQYCLAKGYYGLENLALIPGTVGAAPVQNIGAYGVEVENFILSIDCFDFNQGESIYLSRADCQFGYRDSLIKRSGQGRYLVTSIELKLSKVFKPELSYAPLTNYFEKVKATPKALFDKVCQLRQSKLPDPNKLANAGSFFKNPVVSQNQYQELKTQFPEIVAFPLQDDHHRVYKIAAGWLIENAGFKGKRFDGVGVHQHQALVLVNYSETCGNKIWQLAETIMLKIKQRFGIDLEPEVRILGS
jgi:UDP-N-acetylmuramate dehydrogenase